MAEADSKSNGRRLTLSALAEAKRLPIEFLRELGLYDRPGAGVSIPYYDITGTKTLAIKARTALAARDGSYWPKDTPLAAYGQWRLHEAQRAGILILVEGESDCWGLWFHQMPALGIPGASAAKTLEGQHVEGIEAIYLNREPDRGGASFVEGMGKQLSAIGFAGKVYELRMPDGIKDPADLHVADPEKFKDRLRQAILNAKLLEPAGSSERNGKPDAPGTAPVGLATTCLDTIRPIPVRWLVPGYYPLGKLILLAGDGGHGKSTMTLDLAACLTTGGPCFGLAYEPLPPADVLLISCEDDFADTVVPRLLSAGADLSRVRKVDGIPTKEGKIAPFNLTYFERMEEELAARPGIRLVVIDPAGAYVGRSGVDDYNDSELRSLLGPMAELAARRQVTILLVKHLVKGATSRAVHKVGGSAGYVNTVRAAFVVAPDREDADKKLFLPLKFNLGPRPAGLAYRMRPLDPLDQRAIFDKYGSHLDAPDQDRLGEQLFRIEWLGTVDVDAEQVLSEQARRQRDPNKVEKCMEWLKQFLASYAFPSDEILAAAKKEGFTFDNLKEAKAKLKDNGLRHSNRGRLAGDWWSGFGDPDSWTLRPSTPHTPQSPHTGPDLAPQGVTSNGSPSQGSVGSVGGVGSAAAGQGSVGSRGAQTEGDL
jgi:hypothetical protein